ncbi:MAG: CHAT domain-containing tetratricopeptide repeat protein [Anaerolineales bacterium]|jgi:CHAT domain-containing protein/Tfp pilus assembly protein PilF|nr:CHAT domain-containing tetratricopeptide repeat protein [Anaerolineales bacterium]
MTDTVAFQSYLKRANDVLSGKTDKKDLIEIAGQLPPLNQNLLEQLAQAAEEAALSDARRAWAIALLADSSARDGDLLLQSCAAWVLARAYNHCGQPKKVTETIARARRGFEELHETGWMAACDWQLNHLAWTKPNFGEAARELETALTSLEQAELKDFAPQCRLALSYAQILCGNFGAAQENLAICEETFITRSDSVNQARCWLNEASCQRRQGNFENAHTKLEQALAVFRQCDAPLDVAKTHYQLGLWYFLSGRDYPQAVTYFEQACAVFDEQGMDLWLAVCENGLAQINIQSGNLTQAIQQLQHARAAFVEHGALGMMADNHNDSGQLELLLGNVLKSLEHFRQAQEIYETLGFEFAAANALSNRGNAAALLGYFQEALNDLELAQKRFQELENPFGMAGCELYLSRIWTDLNQFPVAREHLDQAEVLYRQIQQTAMLGLVYNQRALILSLEDRFAEAAAALDAALDVSQASGLAPQIALAERRLGEMLTRSGEQSRALALLTGAEAKFQQMGMSIEQAASLAALGVYHAQTSSPENAEKSFREALALCQGIMPEIESRCHAGLAALAEESDQLTEALAHYRKAVQAIARLRHSFWQPALAGAYLRTVKDTLDNSVHLAASLQAAEDTLAFIEGSKAQALARQLSASIFTPITDQPAEIQALGREIQELQAQIRAIYTPSPWSRIANDLKTLQGKLIETAQTYDRRLAALERKSARRGPGQNPEFDLARFCEQAGARLGKAWLALDYYLAGKTIIISLITPDSLEVFEADIPARVRMALDVCARSHRGAADISSGDMKALGQVMLPEKIQAYLSSPNIPLIISPHRALHSVPWGALQPTWNSKYLVEICVPALTPSLQFLQLLWQREDQEQTPDRATGLLLGVSDFQGKLPGLPSAVREVQAIAKIAHPNSCTLLDAEATWDALCAQTTTGLSAFAFLHISSHMNHDSRTGRLSSLALYEQEIGLDRLRELVPLPGLVTLSACNGAQSLVYEGDEHVGMSTTSLMAGANTVVGSLWPVLDSAPAADMTRFYQGFFAGLSPAEALAQAQRTSIQNGEELQDWAGFLCLGS